jgi:hypothetical protein
LIKAIKTKYKDMASHLPGTADQKIAGESAVTLMVSEPENIKKAQSSKKSIKQSTKIDPPVIAKTVRRRAKGVK